ncbi:MAG: PilX N-terminal domain-containing pilus assembly protein [Pyrinomonadaceae bacterium]
MNNQRTYQYAAKYRERGAALAVTLIILAILSVVALTALAFSSTEARIAGSDLQRTQTFYAGTASIEKMTSDFSDLFRKKINPTPADISAIENNPPAGLISEGFSFQQSLTEDTAKLNELQSIQGLPSDVYPRVNIPNGPYAGLYASIVPFRISTIATQDWSGAEVQLEREFNNYLVPLFQFGMYSNEDIEMSPGPMLTFNGRIHTNKNLYVARNTKLLNRITAAGEFVRDASSDGETNTLNGNQNVWVEVNGINVQSTLGNGSVKAGSGTVGGPNFTGSSPGDRGYYPGSPNGIANPNWETESVKPANGAQNRFGGQLLTNTTGATDLKTPLELSGHSPAELIKRELPTDTQVLSDSRFHTKSQIRILIDDEGAGSGGSNLAGIPAGKGVNLSAFTPVPLDGGNALRRVSNTGAYIDSATIKQKESASITSNALTVRGVKNTAESGLPHYIPPGAGIQGRILIEVVRPDGTAVDVTTQILSMGMTVGEPNGIVYLQRPLWAAYAQGSRDRDGNGFDLVNLTRNYQSAADGEIVLTPAFDPKGFIKETPVNADEDSISNGGTGQITRSAIPLGGLDTIVPINVYNVREGWYRSQLNKNDVYERGITSVVDINMRNLARWLDGIYDSNLLAGTSAVSSNINGEQGYIVYVSDRRGDKIKVEFNADGTSYLSTNGIVDNEDIYGPNSVLEDGEDVIDFGWEGSGTSKKGTLQRDLNELPTTGVVYYLSTYSGNRSARANVVLQNANSYFRRAVRLFDGETLSFSAAANKLSPTKGITVSAENMVYILGNYNATGITGIPPGGSTLNNGGYTGPQVPSSIVCDAFFPLSKTWFDALPAMFPEGTSDADNMAGTPYRAADDNLPSISESTTVRAGIIAGTTISSQVALPGRDAFGSRKNGGIINYPRFLEIWNFNGTERAWNYSGSFIPLYRSTQALSQWENDTSTIYMPPKRNWSFDNTFLSPNKLPPGTPFFQYVQATAFRQIMR